MESVNVRSFAEFFPLDRDLKRKQPGIAPKIFLSPDLFIERFVWTLEPSWLVTVHLFFVQKNGVTQNDVGSVC